MKTGLIFLPQAEKHRAPAGHPENADRVQFAVENLLKSDLADKFSVLNPAPADPGEIINTVHDPEYIRHLKTSLSKDTIYLDPDTYVTLHSFEAARETAAAAIAAVDMILSGQCRRIFLAGRPPGHHAEYNHGMGFCLINNTAVAAEQAIKKHGLKKVAIVDWDVHHGNGTQHYFYSRADVFFVSLHRYPFYPGSGATAERGVGAGEGYTLNMPLPQGTGDDLYLKLFDEIIVPSLTQYGPEFIIITAGFDAHRDDPMGGMHVTEKGFGLMTRRLLDIADRFSGGRVLSLFEGGYSPAGNARSLYEHIKEMTEE